MIKIRWSYYLVAFKRGLRLGFGSILRNPIFKEERQKERKPKGAQ